MGGVMKTMSSSDRHQRVDDGVVEVGGGFEHSSCTEFGGSEQLSCTEFGGSASYEHLSCTECGDLPELCIAQILRVLSPKDIAKLTCTSRGFRDAALSDLVWQPKLPSFYKDVLANLVEAAPPASVSKKQIYDLLCRPLLFKEGHEAFWLDKASGGVCRSQGARALDVVWGSDQRYWDWLPREGSRFAEVAYLKAVCWLEVKGQMECTLPAGRYTLFWRLSLAAIPFRSESYICHALAHVYGWSNNPVIFTLTTDDEQQARSEHYLDPDLWEMEMNESLECLARREVQDRWMEYNVGEFSVEEGQKGSGIGRVKLQYSLVEVKGGNWKSGLVVDGVVIRPIHVKPEPSLDGSVDGVVIMKGETSVCDFGRVRIPEPHEMPKPCQ